jgi:hypothetical protein
MVRPVPTLMSRRPTRAIAGFAVPLAWALAASAPPAGAQGASVPEGKPAADTVATSELRDVGDVLGSLFHRSPVQTEVVKEARPGLSVTLLPSLGYNPSYGAFVGVSVSLGGWLGERETTQLSAGSLGASYSTTEQVSVQFRSDFYLPDNSWVLKGDWRYLDTSQDTYGLGPSKPQGSAYPMDFVLYRLHQIVYRRVEGSAVYVGFGVHYDRYANIVDQRAENGEPTPFSVYSGGTPEHTQSIALSANILIDTRDNAINAARGMFWNGSIRSYQKAYGSDQDRQSLWSDFRAFQRLPRTRRSVLAIWSTMCFTFGNAPYLDLPAIGWDTYGRSGRGYLQGNLRGTNQIYNEFEYRVRLSRNDMWGAVGFVNLMATTAPGDGAFGTLDPGFGVGMRMKFNKKTSTNLSVDAARGQDDQTRWFFGLQEVF